VLPAERAWLYRPETEWTYSHHPHLAYFGGRFFAIWSTGRENEDDLGQRVLIAWSEDFRHWSPPVPLAGPLTGKHSELVLTAAGFHQHAGTLVAYFGQYEYRPEAVEGGKRKPGDKGHMDTGLWALTSRDGEQWSEPVDLGVPIVPNHGPEATASGRLIICGNVMYPWSLDPAGLAGWTPTGIYPPELADEVVDDSEGFWRVRDAAGWPVGLCEGSFYETPDGVLHMLLRTNTERRHREPRRRADLVAALPNRLHGQRDEVPLRPAARRPLLPRRLPRPRAPLDAPAARALPLRGRRPVRPRLHPRG
jgi:hypothetical protein